MRRHAGFTIIELVIVIALAAILGSAFAGLAIPQINLFFFLSQRLRIQNAATDLLSILYEGDVRAAGLRYAGSSLLASAITAASSTSLTYTYIDSGGTTHTVAIAYNAASGTVTRQIDGGTSVTIPYYATAASGIKFGPAETNFFRYYDSTNTELTGAGIVAANVYRVDTAVKTSSGSGDVSESEGQILMKTGGAIKRFTS